MCERGFAPDKHPYGGTMTPEELDLILSSEDLLEPSSDFTVDVMARVRLQAAEPSPFVVPLVSSGDWTGRLLRDGSGGSHFGAAIRAGFNCDGSPAG
jgi:hypothetical protein